MISAEDLAAVRVAVELCNDPQLKEEIFSINVMDSPDYRSRIVVPSRKLRWDENMETKSIFVLENLGLGKGMQEKISGFIMLIGIRMLTWAKDNDRFLKISPDSSLDILNSSHFTSWGIIDNKKAAEELMKYPRLNVIQRYKLACHYCFADQIPVFFKQISDKEKKELESWYESKRSTAVIEYWHDLVSFLSPYIGDKIYDLFKQLSKEENEGYFNVLRIKSHFNDWSSVYCLFEKALETENRVAIEFCLERTWVGKMREILVPLVRKDHFIDILCFLFDRLTVDQRKEFLNESYKGIFISQMVSIAPRYYLDWPHQDYFMSTVNLMWDFLPCNEFVILLALICKKIEFESEKGPLQYGEAKSYNYRKLLNKLWCESPQRYKRFLFSNKEPIIDDKVHISVKYIILKIFLFVNFTNEDKRNVEIIFQSVTDEEKREIFSSDAINMCFKFMSEEKWGRLSLFVSCCEPSPEIECRLRKLFCAMVRGQSICIKFLEKKKYDAAESFLKWSTLSEEEIEQLKREMVNSVNGTRACLDFVLDYDVKSVKMLYSWFISSEDELKEFKKELIIIKDTSKYDYSQETFYFLIICSGVFEKADEFISWCISKDEDQREFKKNLAYSVGIKICSHFILESYMCEGFSSCRINEYGQNVYEPLWEQVEMFLTWCFSSEEEITEFKRQLLLEDKASEIHYKLIRDNKWSLAETFIAWLELSSEEIRELKNKTLLNQAINCKNFGWEIIKLEKWEETELFLRWCYSDRESILKFKDKFDKYFGFKYDQIGDVEIPEYQKINLNKFYLLIDELKDDIHNM